MTYSTSEGQSIYYEIQGNITANKTIVFLNGLTQSTEAWGLVTPYFKADYKIVLLDFIFQGKSSKEGEWRDFDQHASDIEELFISLKLEHIVLLGLSYGSLVAQHYAVKFAHRLKQLILVSTFANKTPYYEAIELAWWRALQQGGYQLMLDIMLPSVLSENYFAKPIIPIQMMKDARKELNENSQAIFNLMKATAERKDYREELHHIATPTLIVQGEKDSLLPVHLAEEVHKNIKGSKLVVIGGAGHTLNLEHVPDLIKAVKDFLN